MDAIFRFVTRWIQCSRLRVFYQERLFNYPSAPAEPSLQQAAPFGHDRVQFFLSTGVGDTDGMNPVSMAGGAGCLDVRRQLFDLRFKFMDARFQRGYPPVKFVRIQAMFLLAGFGLLRAAIGSFWGGCGVRLRFADKFGIGSLEHLQP